MAISTTSLLSPAPYESHPFRLPYLPNSKLCLDCLLSVADTVAGSLGVPEQNHAVFRHHVRYSDEMPVVVVAFVEGALNLLHDIRVLVHRKLLGVVSAVRLVRHTMFPFPWLLEFTV